MSLILLEAGLRISGAVYLSLQERRNIAAIKKKGAYRIMCIGGSTTALGESSSYPNQLEKILNKRNIGIKFSVINKGIPGVPTDRILEQLEENLDKYDSDMIIAMLGINDDRRKIPYQDSSCRRVVRLLTSLRIYKLWKLINLNFSHLWNNKQENSEKTGWDYIEIWNELDRYSKQRHQDFLMGNTKRSIEILNGERMLCPKGQQILVSEKGGKMKDKEEIKKLLKLGNDYIDHGKFEEAEEAFRRIIQIDPNNAQGYYSVGWSIHMQKRQEDAEPFFEKAINLAPTWYRYHVAGHNYFYQWKISQAEGMLKKALDLHPDRGYINTYLLLGQCYIKQGRYDMAEQLYKEAIAEDCENIDRIYGNLAFLYKKLGNDEKFHEYLEKANDERMKNFSPLTHINYQRIYGIIRKRGLKLVCVQYPVRKIEPLKRIFGNGEDVIFVDNEQVFKDVLRENSFEDVFWDRFGGDFGHCTVKGNRILAENIADVILKRCFNVKDSYLNKSKTYDQKESRATPRDEKSHPRSLYQYLR